MQLGDALVEALIAIEVRYVFGVSGANIEHLHDAIHRLGRGRIASVMTKTEDGAAFMADGYARRHRRLGVCCATSGGGMLNLIAGVAEANQSSVPLLAIVGQPPMSVEGRGAFQDSSGIGRSVNAVQLFSSVSKYTRKVDRPDIFWDALRDAIVAAVSGRPGAAVLLIPRSIYTADVGEVPPQFRERLDALTAPPPVDRDQVRALLDELRLARRPVLIIGQGAMRTKDPTPLIEFANDIGIPVVTTMGARGEYPNDHPDYLGVLGVAGHPSAHAYVRDHADLLLLAGTGLNTMTRTPFARDPVDLPQKRLVAVSMDVGELLRVIEPKLSPNVQGSGGAAPMRSWWPAAVQGLALAIQGDLGTVFSVAREMWAETPFKVKPRGPYQMMDFVPEAAPTSPRMLSSDEPANEDEPLLQSVALECLALHLPARGTLVYDAGNCAAAALHMLPVPRGVPSIIALGMGGMGYAIAAGVGAALESPQDHRTVVFTGDGSFLMTGFEVHTAVDLQVPVLFVVFNNNMHGMCATRQQVFFESRYECVSYGPLDVATVARGLGAPHKLWVAKASTKRELEAALLDYAKQGARPGVLELRLDVEELPPFTPLLKQQSPVRHSLIPSSRR